MSGSITVKEVAQVANVSIGTVSRVFNNHSNVSEEIRQRVLKAAAELGYFGPGNQSSSAQNGSRSLRDIGFLFCSLLDQVDASVTANPYWSHIFHGVENEARKSNIRVTYRNISDIGHLPHVLTAMLYELHLGGILLVGPTNIETIKTILDTQARLVLIDTFEDTLSSSVDAVLGDNASGTRQVMNYLIDLGHRRIAFLGGPVASSGTLPTNLIYTVEQRAISYCMAHLHADLPIDPLLIESSTMVIEGGYEACKRLLKRNVPFTALVCANDSTAIGAIKALQEAGHRVPQDISVVGFDDIDVAQYLTPSLTTVRIDKEGIGRTALQQLLARVAEPDSPYTTQYLNVQLIKRDSVAVPGM